MISTKGLKFRMSNIKLSVHLTIEYTITGTDFVLILKPRLWAYGDTLFRQVTAQLAKILTEYRMQVQLSKNEKKHHAHLTSM